VATAVTLALTGCAAGIPAPATSPDRITSAAPSFWTTEPIPNDVNHPYTEVICGQTWSPGRGVPVISPLVDTPSPPPPAPARSDFPTPQPDTGTQHVALRFGDCVTGAIVTVTPSDAAIVDTVFYAADGGVAFMTLVHRENYRSLVVRAWLDDGTYLGEYTES